MTGLILAVTGLKREAGLLAGEGVRAIVSGGDVDALSQRLDQALSGETISGIISVGLGGALSPKLAVGDWVLATSIIAGAINLPTDQAWTARLKQGLLADSRHTVHLGPIAGVDHMVVDGAAKAALHADTKALAVDMESHVAAAFAQRHRVPFAALRVISDGADRALPAAAQAGMKKDGGMNIPAVLWSLAKDPRQLPALIRTGREAETAFKALLDVHDLLGRTRV
ncbi:MAG: phosphorylase family protein [Caulobacteraceae bacterium]